MLVPSPLPQKTHLIHATPLPAAVVHQRFWFDRQINQFPDGQTYRQSPCCPQPPMLWSSWCYKGAKDVVHIEVRDQGICRAPEHIPNSRRMKNLDCLICTRIK